MVAPEIGFSEAVRRRIIELTGTDPGQFKIVDVFPGERYHETSFEERVDMIARGMIEVVMPTNPPHTGRGKP